MPIRHGQEGYLQRCLREFSGICRLKYGVEFELSAVEQKVKHLRRRTPLAYEDLKYFESPDHWWFQRFWVFPPKDSIEPALRKETFDFWNLPDSNEAEIVRRLLYIFKSIELVSIILRFIRPEHYSIYSSPVQHMLEIRHGRSPVETYLAYLNNMREIEQQYGFSRVADVDMALWVLHEKCFGVHRDQEVAAAYAADDFMLQLKARNLVAPLAEISDAKLARALSGVKPEIAVLVACHCFEALIRNLAKRLGVSAAGARKLELVIEDLPNYELVTPVRKALWRSIKSWRNEFMHSGAAPSPHEIQVLLDEVNRLEEDLKSDRTGGYHAGAR